ncbi:low molecular weight protein-tyrosine-phosphatase [Neptuniibacter caesariensis]|uniref:protein-tyrosine-phosphatase n=1 Tax=Neptuniibacter caesariensis TaxID=207954 RepID=A0A7U8C7K1_NEPCE|nr:low molecular weight protein-tyrosine-phosphatase [Neptuniibacter caesariensis]EAR62131.1 phosphotyrosine protein phosphatase [Oceanospirillum sp. MED92] [Neptuniibacter caesariensis]
MIKVLFVCLGNICRSPTADGVFRQVVEQRGLTEQIKVDSAGTAAYHVGNPPDHRSTLAAKKRGYDLSLLRARQAVVEDFTEFDYVLAMDHENLLNLKAIKPSNFTGHLGLFLDFAEASESEVPDPYYGGDSGFEHVLDLVEAASEGLLQEIERQL